MIAIKKAYEYISACSYGCVLWKTTSARLLLQFVVCVPFSLFCVVWMGVDRVCHILRPDGGAEKREYSGDQIKDERDSSIKVETQKTEEETHSRSGCQRAREGGRHREREREW